MDLSSVIAFIALLVSVFTFYWTSIRRNKALYLVRIDNTNIGLLPEFVFINSGSDDVLITSVVCAFEQANGKGSIAPNIIDLGGDKFSFSIQPGKSHHCVIMFDKVDINEQLAKGGEYRENGTLQLYHKDMKVIVDWIDHKGIEYSAEAKIFNYGMELDGTFRIRSPRVKHHELYKVSSKKDLYNYSE